MLDFVTNEVKSSLKSKGKKRKSTKFLPFWDSNLLRLWKLMHESERIYRKMLKKKESNKSIEKAKVEFKKYQKNFDKLLKCKKREYDSELLLEIEECVTSNPTKFWSYINNLGPKENKKHSVGSGN